MHKISITSLFLIAALSIAGCAGVLSIPDAHQLVSNYHAEKSNASADLCDFNSWQAGAAENRGHGLDPEAIRLLNWNVYKGTSENWMEDFSRLSRDKDIVALQEAQLHPDFKAGLERSRLHWDLTTAFIYGGAETGVLLASNIEPGAVCALHSEEPVISIPKSALVSEYRIEGAVETLMVANIHMINFSFGTTEYSEQIARLRQVIQQHQGPLIVTGDFNTWSDGRMAIIADMADALQLSAVEYLDDQRLTVFGRPLDNIYFRGLRASKVETEQVESSDHNPMTVTFRLASQ